MTMHPAFLLPTIPITRQTRRPLPTTIVRTSPHASANPNDNHSTPGRHRQNALNNAAVVAAAASLLTLSVPSLSLDAILIPQFVSAAHARGGGASFVSASGDVIKDPESLLRWSLPVSNPTVRTLQAELEGAVNDLRGLKWSKIENHVKRAQYVVNNQTKKILTSVPDSRYQDASNILSELAQRIPDVEAAVSSRKPDKLTQVCRDLLRDVGTVEQMMVTGFPYDIPEEYASLPQLRGRATVEMIVRKGADETFDINGVLKKEGKITLILDGYSAPITAGNFADLVNKGFYDDTDVVRSDGFIVQAGKPKNGDGFIDKETGNLRSIPLEVFAKGDKEPTYGITLEDDGRGASSTVLPFTSYGTLAMARNELEPNSASSQFFWFLFEPDLTPAGRNLMDGNWSVMGYTTEGQSFLRGLQKGDKVVSAKIVDGLQNLKNVT